MKFPDSADILIFTDWYLPGYKAGGPVVSIANMVKALGPHMQITVVCRDRDYLDSAPFRDIESDVWQPHGDAAVYYLSPGRSSYATIAGLVRSVNPKVIYINGLFSKVFSIFPLFAARRGDERVIVAPRGMLAPGALGIKPVRKRIFLIFAKMIGLYRRIELHATHDHEAGHIRKILGSRVPVKVLPNLPSLWENEPKPAVKPAGELRVLTVARVAREKNLHFALECLVKAAETHRVSLTHIGPVYDEAYAARCREIADGGNLKVEWLGPMPSAEIGRLYGKVHLFFLPSLSENFGHAIAEALLHGIPVLTSDQTPWRKMQSRGWGADFPLGRYEPYVHYICDLADKNSDEYRVVVEGISKDVRDHLALRETIEGYNAYFA